MSYLPIKSLAHKFVVRMPNCKLPTVFSSVGGGGGGGGRLVNIIPYQRIAGFENGYMEIHSRQHWMPHSGQVATAIQTTVGKDGVVGPVETITIFSTPASGLYTANYVLYESGVGGGVTFCREQLKYDLKILTPHTLEWIGTHLLPEPVSRPWKLKAFYRPMFFSCGVYGGG